MSDHIQITDRESLEAWLNTRTREDSVIIAHRAAMRVAPVWIAALAMGEAPTPDLTAAPLMRLNLIAGVGAKRPGIEIRPVSAARAAVTASVSSEAGEAASAASAVAAASYADSAIASAARAAVSAAEAADAEAVWKSIENDARSMPSNEALAKLPLWPSSNPLEDLWTASVPILRDTPGGAFWIDWYQRALDGRPQNWDLLRDVALIEDSVWQAGGVALGERIAREVERHRLLEEVRRLREGLAEARLRTAAVPDDGPDGGDRPGMGHNQPPEALDGYSDEVSTQVEVIAKELANAEAELAKPDSSPSALRRLGQGLLNAATAVLGYSAKLADQAAQAAAKKLGEQAVTWALRGGFAYIIMNIQPIKELAEAVIRLAGRG